MTNGIITQTMYFGNLPEEFALIAIDNERQNFAIGDRYLEFGLVGAVLLELTIQGRVAFKANDVIVTDKSPVDDEIVQKALNLIIEEEEVQSALYWIRRLSSEMDDVKEQIIDRLENKGMIDVERETKFLIFKTEKFKIIEKEKEQIIKEHIRDIVNQKEESNSRALGFLSLIYSTGITTEIFDEEELEKYLQQIRAIVKDEEVGGSISQSIQLIADAMMRNQILNYHQYLL